MICKIRDLRQILQICLFIYLLLYSWDRPYDGYKLEAETFVE